MTTQTIISRLRELATAADDDDVIKKILDLADKLSTKHERQLTSEIVTAAKVVQNGDAKTKEWIHAAKTLAGSVERLAEITGRSVPSVYGWFSGRTIPAKAAEAIRNAYR